MFKDIHVIPLFTEVLVDDKFVVLPFQHFTVVPAVVNLLK